jgi:hypothetical protein
MRFATWPPNKAEIILLWACFEPQKEMLPACPHIAGLRLAIARVLVKRIKSEACERTVKSCMIANTPQSLVAGAASAMDLTGRVRKVEGHCFACGESADVWRGTLKADRVDLAVRTVAFSLGFGLAESSILDPIGGGQGVSRTRGPRQPRMNPSSRFDYVL